MLYLCAGYLVVDLNILWLSQADHLINAFSFKFCFECLMCYL